MSFVVRLFACGLVASMALGCEIENTAVGRLSLSAQPLSTTAATACAESAAALCAKVESCSTDYVRFVYGTRAECEAQVEDACRARYEGPGATRTPPSCANAAAAVRCEEIIDPSRPFVGPLTPGTDLFDVCPTGAGAHAAGEPCLRAGDCASGKCAFELSSRCGTCAPERPEGTACGSSDGRCAAPLVCRDGRCMRPLKLEGERCAKDDECFSGACYESTCAKAGAVGDACDTDSKPCSLGLAAACNTQTKRCEKIGVAPAGDVCTSTLSISPGAIMCEGATACTAGHCAPRAGEGTPCTKETSCGLGLSCSQGKCVRRHPAQTLECGPPSAH